MDVFQADSYTQQTARILEKEICSGTMEPGKRLASVRLLAERFHVSTSVIVNAVTILEKKRLVVRKERKGIYVSEHTVFPKALEVVVLVFDSDPFGNSFLNRMLSVISAPEALDRIRFTIRTVLSEESRKIDQTYMMKLLKNETMNLNERHFDCALIAGGSLERKHIKECLKLSCPVMFLGNFRNGEEKRLRYNRLGFNENLFETIAEYADRQGLKQIQVIYLKYWESEPEFFMKSFHHGAALAGKKGISMNLIPECTGNRSPEAERIQNFRKIAENLSKDAKPGTLYVFSCIDRAHLLLAEMEKCGIHPVPGSVVFLNAGSGANIRDLRIHRMFDELNSLNEFYKQFCQLIFQLAERKLENYRTDYLLYKEII